MNSRCIGGELLRIPIFFVGKCGLKSQEYIEYTIPIWGRRLGIPWYSHLVWCKMSPHGCLGRYIMGLPHYIQAVKHGHGKPFFGRSISYWTHIHYCRARLDCQQRWWWHKLREASSELGTKRGTELLIADAGEQWFQCESFFPFSHMAWG